MVRCPKHGRVYDSATANGCSMCLQEAEQPRAPARMSKVKEPPKQSSFAGFLLTLVLLGGAGYGAWWYFVVRHRPSDAQIALAASRARAASALGERLGDTSKFVDPNDLTPVRNARACKAALEALISSHQQTLLGFEAGPVDSTARDRATQRKVRAYFTFQSRWNAGIDAATRKGSEFRYPPGTRLGPQMDAVSDQIGAALSVLRDMVPRERVKSHAERQSDLTEASGFLNAAGTILTNLPK